MAYTGIPEALQLGFGWLDQLHPDDRAPTVAAWEAAVAAGTDFHVEFRIRRHDGEYRWFDTQALRLHGADGTTVKWFGSNTDITERRACRGALRESEDKFRYVFDHSPIGMSFTLPSGEINVNDAFCQMLGYLREEFDGSNWQEVSHPDDSATQERSTPCCPGPRSRALRQAVSPQERLGRLGRCGHALRRDAAGEPLYLMTCCRHHGAQARRGGAAESEERLRSWSTRPPRSTGPGPQWRFTRREAPG